MAELRFSGGFLPEDAVCTHQQPGCPQFRGIINFLELGKLERNAGVSICRAVKSVDSAAGPPGLDSSSALGLLLELSAPGLLASSTCG